MSEAIPEDWPIPITQAAALLGVPQGTLGRWVSTGGVPVARRHKGLRLVRLADVRAQVARLEACPRARGGRMAAALRGTEHEPTAEEVERMVAEQMQNLPAWWFRDAERQKAKSGPGIRVISEAVLFGRRAG